MAPPLAVTRYNQGGYMVRSQVRADQWYLVLLDDPKFPDGWCDCMNAACRIVPFVSRGEEPPYEVACKHCRRVRAELAHARSLCLAAGLPENLSQKLIPMHHEQQ